MTDEASPQDGAAKKFPWKSWTSIGAKRKLRIIGWPNSVVAPGPDFDYHTIESDEIKLILGNFIATLREGRDIKESTIPRIKQWTSGTDYKLSDVGPMADNLFRGDCAR